MSKTDTETTMKSRVVQVVVIVLILAILGVPLTIWVTGILAERRQGRDIERDRLQTLCESFGATWDPGWFIGEEVCVMPDGTRVDPETGQKHLDQ